MKKSTSLGLLYLAASLALAGAQAADPSPQPSPAAAPSLAVYRWGAANRSGGAKANEAFAQWLNRPYVWAEDFTPHERWEGAIEGGGWQLAEWSTWKKAVPGRRLILSVPMLPGDWNRSGSKTKDGEKIPVSWDAGARGEYNAHFKTLAENLVQYGLGDSVLRLGWEFNGGWYTWRAADNVPGFIEYWKQIVTTMRAVPGAEKLQFCWNPAQAWLQFPADKAWPGDAYVDIVGLDFYDQSWSKDTYPWPDDTTPEAIEARQVRTWNDVLYGGSFGLKFWRDFAIQHNKPFAIPEWGVCKRGDKHGGLDNPYFVEQVYKFISDPTNRVLFHCYFDVEAPDGGHQLSPGLNNYETKFPKSAAKFKELFSQGTPTPAAP